MSVVQRVSVVGSSGSGKTTFSLALAAHLGVPCIELDALFWQQGAWVEPETAVFRERVHQALAVEAWVTDGNYQGRLGTLVWERADTVVWLDLPLAVSLWRICRRAIPRILRREMLWVGNRETWRNFLFDRKSILYYAIRHYRRRRVLFEERLRRPGVAHLRVHRFRSSGAAYRWLAGLETLDQS